MIVTRPNPIAATIMAKQVTQAFVRGGYKDLEVKAVHQEGNMTLAWDNVNAVYIIAPVSLQLGCQTYSALITDRHENSTYVSNEKWTMTAEPGVPIAEYNQILLSPDEDGQFELCEHPDKYVIHENLKYTDVFNVGLRTKYVDTNLEVAGVDVVRKQVLLTDQKQFFEYAYRLFDNNDFDIVGVPIRTWTQE